MKTTIVNKTKNDVSLKERTAGVFRFRHVIQKDGGKYVVDVNPEATYKEYWCVTNNDDLNAVILSSDDCLDWSKIEILVKDNTQTPSYYWKGVDSRKSNTTSATHEAGAKGWFGLKAFFKRGETST